MSAEVQTSESQQEVHGDTILGEPAGLASANFTERLLAYIASEGFREGDKLPGERVLSEALGVSRHILRESLRTLNLLGFVDVRHGDGTYWKKQASSNLPRSIEWQLLAGGASTEQLIEARAEIEVLVCAMAAERATADHMAQIRQWYEFMVISAASGDAALYSRSDLNFHLCIAKAAGNTVLEGVLSSIRTLIATWTQKVLQRIELAESLAVHEPIMRALEARDPIAARDAMRAHMDAAASNLLDAMSGSE